MKDKLAQQRYQHRQKAVQLHMAQELTDRTRYLVSKICKACDVTEMQLFGNLRLARIAVARKLLYQLLREAGYTYQEIARIANRHYSTIIHYVKTPIDEKYIPLLNKLRRLSTKWEKKRLSL